MAKKYIYSFGNGKAEGSAKMSNILGGKGANLAEMTNMKIPVPPGFTISSDVCVYYMNNNKFPVGFKKEVNSALLKVEQIMKLSFGCKTNPLLVSIRSGSRKSMPGMMETVLNVGLTEKTLPGLIAKTKNSRFVFDSFRRLIMMYADVVMDKGMNIKEKNIRLLLESHLSKYKKTNKIANDSELKATQLEYLNNLFQNLINKNLNHSFPHNCKKQLWSSIEAVFKSWNGKRAKEYRKIEKIPDTWGTAVNVQAMVFGNMGNDSATGVAFTRNPANGLNCFFGEWLPNAQGEDVVAGLRTPYPINDKSIKTKKTLKHMFPKIYSKLFIIQKKLENHYKDMLDIEFTIQKNTLWLLQARVGKRSGHAAIKIALDLLKEKTINKKIALSRINSNHINELLLPSISSDVEKNSIPIASGLPAGPGAASGQIVFDADVAKKLNNKGLKIILVRNETSPEDIHGMFASQAILTSRGGMTSHAALVARGWGKCCIVGCHDISINNKNKSFIINKKTYNELDWLTLNGTVGKIYNGKLNLIKQNFNKQPLYKSLLALCKVNETMSIRANVDRDIDAIKAKKIGAVGVGLCRTEHMFFNPQRISLVRKMIISSEQKDRLIYVNKLLPYQQKDFYKLFKAMSPHPVTVRLLDPPLHEFLPQTKEQFVKLAKDMNTSYKAIKEKTHNLKETNPMLGHRGCRLGISFPEITEMQIKAIIKAVIQLQKKNIRICPEIMVPLVGSVEEFVNQKKIILNIIKDVCSYKNVKIKYLIGTMIELPRACLIADKIAKHADFLSFGTNDLTQTTFGISRDDAGSFLPKYLSKNIFSDDPFAIIDEDGVGELIKIAVKKARKENPKIKIGICGEHGGDPQSIRFFKKLNFNYISCSPYRVPVAYLTLAKIKYN